MQLIDAHFSGPRHYAVERAAVIEVCHIGEAGCEKYDRKYPRRDPVEISLRPREVCMYFGCAKIEYFVHGDFVCNFRL